MHKIIDVSVPQPWPAPTRSGTHVEAPAGSKAGGPTVDQLPLEILIGKARVVEVAPGTVERLVLEKADLRDDIRVLIRARSDKAVLSEDAAAYLVQAGIKLVGFDQSAGGSGEQGSACQLLLRSGVIVVEGLDLSQVAAGEYEMTCLPLRLSGAAGAPARVVLRARP